MKYLAFAAFIMMAFVGCASHRRFYGGGVYFNPSPKVTLAILRCEEDVDFPPISKIPASVAIYYPFEMVRAGITGEVVATITVEQDGTPSSIVIDRASQKEFSESAIAGLKRCAFFPAKRTGVPIRSIVQCKIDFSLDED